MRSLAVIFRQPVFCNFPGFIQSSEQIKIQDFRPVRPLKAFDKCILRRLTCIGMLKVTTLMLII